MQLEKHGESKNHRGNPNWVKGQSGNPKGRPRNGVCITSRQKELLIEICPFDAKGRTWLETLAEAGMRLALTTPVALNNLQDRLEGKVTQPIGGDGGQPIKVEITVVSETAKKITEEILQGKGTE